MSSKRGQALLELAIFGSLALLAMAFMLQIGLRMNFQQEIEQQTFRSAMREASNRDKRNRKPPQVVSYLQYRDRQTADPGQGFAIMPRFSTQGQSTVSWGKFLTFLTRDDKESKPLTVVSVNGQGRINHFGEIPSGPFVKKVTKNYTVRGTVSQSSGTASLSTTANESTSVDTSVGGTGSGLSNSVGWSGNGW